jgi:hypothetical protein
MQGATRGQPQRLKAQSKKCDGLVSKVPDTHLAWLVSPNVQVAERARQELAHNPLDPPMLSIFRDALVNMRAFPKLNEFKVRQKFAHPI